MNLKEAFRFQNKLTALTEEAESILCCPSNITREKNTYLRKKVMPEAEDETTVSIPGHDYADQVTELAGFLLWLLSQREKLSAAIRSAKDALPIDMDGQSGLNAARQSAARVLRQMADLRSSEQLISGGGYGYRFNAEGNQVGYKCDVRRVTTINFDRNVIRRYLSELNLKADNTSAALDSCLINSAVDYVPPFDVNDSFAEVFSLYLAV